MPAAVARHTMRLFTMTMALPVAGTAMVPPLSRGLSVYIRKMDLFDCQLAAMSPYLVGTTPRAQRRSPVCGLMLHVA
jgi:hypothetical protein